MEKLKVYFAGKVSPESVLAPPDWRDRFCDELSQKLNVEIISLDPTKTFGDFLLNHNDPKQVFGRNCFFIRSADLVVVNLTDDISVGGSQEMLIAKYYKKPLIGIAPQGGKFRKKEKTIGGKIYRDWVDPYVSLPCDVVVDNLDGVVDFL
ncbi:hypothetical protein HYW30_01455 [Candidatus Azambacteria bacterium]|nr:hypothetical protein [Candidatus Azambacteria bacterium]